MPVKEIKKAKTEDNKVDSPVLTQIKAEEQRKAEDAKLKEAEAKKKEAAAKAKK